MNIGLVHEIFSCWEQHFPDCGSNGLQQVLQQTWSRSC